MNDNFHTGSQIQLDPVGYFYSTISNPKNPGTFGISAYLNEKLDPSILQQAVNDMMKRLPFLNVCLKSGFIWDYHEILPEPPQILPASAFPTPCSHFNLDNAHVIRVLYGENYITIEVLHSVCDGRSLTKIMSALLVHYFELLGVSDDKTGIIDFNEEMQSEEGENAYTRFADHKKTNSVLEKKPYRLTGLQHTTPYSISYNMDLSKIKKTAKLHNATITEYLIAVIFRELAIERSKNNCHKPIAISIPVDCRNFFPSRSLRCFVSHTRITMPETEDFSQMISGIRAQFEKVDSDYIMSDINAMQKLCNYGRFIPMSIKRPLIKLIDRFGVGGDKITTAFSNVGLVKLPQKIEERIMNMAFTLCPEQNSPYLFGCISIGNTLTLTVTASVKESALIDRIISSANYSTGSN